MVKINFVNPKSYEKFNFDASKLKKEMKESKNSDDFYKNKMKEITEKIIKNQLETVKKDFGDVKLLVRRVSKEELANTPAAEVIKTKALPPKKD